MAADLLRYSEQAMNLLGGKLPNIAYLPPSVRARKTRLTTEGVVTDNPLSNEEQIDRIVQADPIGFLIAIMNGQPIPTFRIVDKNNPLPAPPPPRKSKRHKEPNVPVVAHLANEGDVDVFVEYHVPSIGDRERIALYLADRVALPKKSKKTSKEEQPSNEFDTLVEQRARDADKRLPSTPV